jgi:hypothetical protein
MIRIVRAAAISGCALGLLISLASLSGCSSAKPPSDARLQIERIANWRIKFLADHNRKPPKDQAEFEAYVEKMCQERGDAYDRTAMFVSPRDNKDWVVRCGPESAKLSEQAIAVHEQDGYDGKVLVATAMARSSEIDKSELPSKLAIE